MSIFSRKSKSSHSQTVNGKSNGQANPPGSQHAKSIPIGQTVDPIVQRIAIQAASRRRMNSDTPDYSIASASPASSMRHSSIGVSPSSLADYDRRSSRVLQSTGLTKAATADSDGVRLNTANSQKQGREYNKIRKSSITASPQKIQTLFPNGTDPDTQKMRMPWRERGPPSPQVSRDSGYASGATMDSRTLKDLDPPQEPELLRRHRQINASLPSTNGEQPQKRTFSLPASQCPPAEKEPRDSPTTPKSADQERRNSSIYISRLDPGSASSRFMSTPVAPQISKPKQSESFPMVVPAQTAVGPVEPPAATAGLVDTVTTVTTVSGSRPRTKSEASRKSERSITTTTSTSKPRESQPVPTKSDSAPRLSTYRVHRLDSRPSQTKADEASRPVRKPVREQSMAQSPVSRSVEGKDESRSNTKDVSASRRDIPSKDVPLQIPPPEEFQPKSNQPVSDPATPYLTPKESQSPSSRSLQTSSPPKPRPPEPYATVPNSDRVLDSSPEESMNQEPAIGTARSTSTPKAVPSTNATAAPPVLTADIDTQPFSQMRFPTPSPQTEFPYLDGIEKGATMPSVSVLEGYKVNRRGQVLDEEGDIIGELVQGEVIHCVRRRINAQGDVVDDSGNIVGHARPLPRGADSSAAYKGQDWIDTAFYNDSLRSPISPATPYDKQEPDFAYQHPYGPPQQRDEAAKRALNTSDSGGNVVYFELDASVESQAVPVIDHSEIFIPPFGGARSQGKSKSFTNLPETGKTARRRQSNSAYTPSASQEKIILDGRRNSRKWASRYSEAMPGEDSASKTPTDQARRPRSYSAVANNAPKAVLGPTWESLLDTVPVPSQTSPQQAPVANGTIVQLAPQASVRTQAGGQVRPTSSAPVAEGNNIVDGSSSRRRSSQYGVNGKGSPHKPFANSPLSSVAHTPPGTGSDQQPEGSFERQLTAPGIGGIQAPSTGGPTDHGADEDEDAAPAPTVMKRTTAPSTKSGKKRKSIFGIPFGKKSY